jgi:hypothetical protein
MFPGMVDGKRVQGMLTKQAGGLFELERNALGELFRREFGYDAPIVSDANVIEYLVRGERGTAVHLRAASKAEKLRMG